MKPAPLFYRIFDAIVGAVCLFGVVPFSVGGFALGVLAGERLWQHLGITMSVVTVYADMAFGLAGLVAGSYLAFLLIATLYSATINGRMARYEAIHGDEIRERIERAKRAEPGWHYQDSRQDEAEPSDEEQPRRSAPYQKRFAFESSHAMIALPGIASGLPPAPSRRMFHFRTPHG
ncbi:hypothetical protein ACFJIW_12135 [Tahibacter sp. UC22_41]|uniref:hypothetical protein n=1 Tax=Tahibacter sp. UC22_41 TaxID=3350178 RepID=UPI0036DA9D52